MKKIYTTLFTFIIASAIWATTHTITNSGQTFIPANLTIEVGDTVVFNIGNSHDVLEVDETTYDANGITSNGGFSLGSGGGTLTGLTEGKYFYVCTPHANNGMKGIITVEAQTQDTTSTANRDIEIESLRVFPNPATTTATISFESSTSELATISVYNAIGSKVITQSQNLSIGVNSTFLNVADLSTGVYFVEIALTTGKTTQRIVVK